MHWITLRNPGLKGNVCSLTFVGFCKENGHFHKLTAVRMAQCLHWWYLALVSNPESWFCLLTSDLHNLAKEDSRYHYSIHQFTRLVNGNEHYQLLFLSCFFHNYGDLFYIIIIFVSGPVLGIEMSKAQPLLSKSSQFPARN